MIWKVSRWSKKCLDHLERLQMIWKISGWLICQSKLSGKCLDDPEVIFVPFLCIESCKCNFSLAIGAKMWTLPWFMRFIWKDFTSKILLSLKFSFFVTLTFGIVSTDLCLSLSILSQQSFFWPFSAKHWPCRVIWCPVGWLVVGCGAWVALTVERLPILLFILRTQEYCLCSIWWFAAFQLVCRENYVLCLMGICVT